MARVDIKIEHRQPPDTVEEKFQSAIREAEARFRTWIHRVNWSNEGRTAMLVGPGYEVRLEVDDRYLHAQGDVPLAWKLLEGVVRKRLKRALEQAP